MSLLLNIKQAALEVRQANAKHECLVWQFCERLCFQLGIDMKGRSVAAYLNEGAVDNVTAVRAWLDRLHPDWCTNLDIEDEDEILTKLESAIRRSVPTWLQGDHSWT